jgi:hypothetical protein
MVSHLMRQQSKLREVQSLNSTDDSDVVERRLQALRAKALLQRRLQLKKDFGLAFYNPHTGQDKFHKAAGKKYRMVRCGNRYGKSTMGCAEDIAWCIGERPWYPKNDPARTLGIPQKPNKGLIITTDWDKVSEIWTNQDGLGASLGKIWQFAPKGAIVKHKRNHSGAIELLVWANGAILRFDTVESYKKNPMGSESSDWDFIHIDEPCPEDMFKANARGLMDRGGSAWFTLTPLSEFWINDMFFPRQGDVSRFAPEKIWAMQGDTRDNPHLTKESIDDFLSLLTPDEAECRLKGIPLELSGLVYKDFKYDTHVLKELPKGWTDWATPPKDYIIYTAIDCHPQLPHAVLFVAVNQLGQTFIFDELWVKCSAEELAKLVLMKLAPFFYADVKCDPIAWINDPITESCIAEEFGKHGLFVQKASKSKTHGILKMMGEFRKPGKVWVCPTVQRFLFEINRYCYDKTNKPIDKDDHMMECMYRLYINDPEWFNPDTNNAAVTEPVFNETNLDLPSINENW